MQELIQSLPESSRLVANSNAAPARRVYLVGVAAQAVRREVEAELLRSDNSQSPADEPAEQVGGMGITSHRVTNLMAVETILDAVFASGQVPSGGGMDEQRIFLISAGPERDVLEGALRSLRGLNPQARMVLLCEPADEGLCRRARAWGADDYFIVPMNPADVREALAFRAPRPEMPPLGTTPLAGRFPRVAGAAREGGTREANAETPHGPGVLTHGAPSLPLILETELLEDLMTGRPNFAQRGIAALAGHIDFGGNLRFVGGGGSGTGSAAVDAENPAPIKPTVPAPVPAPGRQIRRAVSAGGDQPALGTLVLDLREGVTESPALAAALAQAANWLAGMLSLAQRYEQLRVMAITDELSGAYNRRYFMKYMDSLLERSRENRSHVTLLLFDIDDFKKYNDAFGHASGDAIIRELIKLLRACTRPKDLVARIGGDEFAVVYWDNEAKRQPNSEHPKDMLVATERFREAIRNHQWPQVCKIKGTVSISGGLATFPWDADTLEQLMARADEALLKAKAAGKNVIVMQSTSGARV